MLKAPKNENAKSEIPAGTHVARLYQIVHIGTSHFEYQGQQKSSDKIRLTFELCNEKREFKEGEGEKPLSISREFGLSMGKKSHLRPFVENMLGVALQDTEAYNFDLEDLLGRDCLLNVVHTEKNGNTYADIKGATPLPKGMTAPEQVNPSKVYDVTTITVAELATLPQFLQDKITASDEWQARERNEEDKGKAIDDSNPF
jgi:hypothetical protein